MKLISIVIPVFNEEDNIKNFFERMEKATSGRDYKVEYIFVNDGSKDKSIFILDNLASNNQHVKVIDFSRNFGSYAAIEAGLINSQGEAVMCISCDLQDPPEIINEFYPLWSKGNDIVWGVREGRKDPFFKKNFAKLFYFLVRNLAFDKDFPDDGMDIGMFDKKVIQSYLLYNDRNSIPFFTIYSMGFQQARVPYVRMERVAGESGWPFWKRVKCSIDIMVAFSYFPIRAMTTSGILLSMLSFLYLFAIIFLRLFSPGFSAPGWTSIAALILFMGGIQFIFLGIVAEYLWRTSERVKDFPRFLVKSKIGF